MSAILRASGKEFDVDAFIEDSSLLIDRVYRVGEPVFPASNPEGRKSVQSGLSVVASKVNFEDYKLQMKESFLFMRDHADELRRLVAFKGLHSVCIDFGANIYPPGWCSFYFPHQLMKMAGNLGIDLELSVYPCEPEDNESKEDERRAELNEAYEEFKSEGESGRQ